MVSVPALGATAPHNSAGTEERHQLLQTFPLHSRKRQAVSRDHGCNKPVDVRLLRSSHFEREMGVEGTGLERRRRLSGHHGLLDTVGGVPTPGGASSGGSKQQPTSRGRGVQSLDVLPKRACSVREVTSDGEGGWLAEART